MFLMRIKIISTTCLRGFCRKYSKVSIAMEKETTVKIKGQTINYIKTGQGNRTVLCFPGALGSIWSDFKPQINGLDKNKFTLVAFDPPGYGHSRPPNRSFGPKFYEEDAETAFNLMTELNISRYSLLGWSDGGISSMIMAYKYPDIVEKLVVWGANAYVLPEEVKIYESIRDISKWSDKMKNPLIELYTQEGLQQMWGSWCDALAQISKGGGDICKNQIKQIRCPTLILHGDQDPMIAPEHPDFLHTNISKSKLHRFPNGKHNIHLRYAEEFNRIVSEFLLQ